MAVARDTRLIVGCCVMKERNWIAMQQFVEGLPQASRYCSDALAVYQELLWPDGSSHIVSQKKKEGGDLHDRELERGPAYLPRQAQA